ncbi:hypothetical protein DV738_g3624, partial [Chaetothyriales sp. CBS 135597]
MMPQLTETPSPGNPLYSQYEAARALKSCGINCCIWSEELLCHLKARTHAFDLFFLVANPEESSQRLEQIGFHRIGLNPRYRFMTELLKDSVRLAHPSDAARLDHVQRRPAAVLLSASRWNFPIPQLNKMEDILPPVSLVASSVIDTWLDADTIDFRLLLRSYLGYIVEYVKQTGDDKFEAQLQHEYQRDIWRSYENRAVLVSKRTDWLKLRQAERDDQQSDEQEHDNN